MFMDSKIELVPIGDIDANPFRLLGDYPFSSRKLEALRRSIQGVGLWEGIIGRRKGNRVEIAFGHHRHKAAQLEKMTDIAVIVRDLSDEQMLQFMGRENLEDYNAEFLTMLETWEAGVKFSSASEKSGEAVAIARLLGWTQIDATGYDKMNSTARACHAAYALINAGHIGRSDLKDLSVKSARDIVERTQSRVEQIDKWAAKNKVSHSAVAKQKGHVSHAAKSVAKQVREGKIAQKDSRKRVDMEAFSRQIKQDRGLPKFAKFGEALGDQISNMLTNDSTHEKLVEVEAMAAEATDPNDIRIIGRLVFELTHLAKRADDHIGKLDLKRIKGASVMPLRAISSE
jgi:ParB/RepB/Spo0J family partition protein